MKKSEGKEEGKWKKEKKGKFPVGALVTGEGDDDEDDEDGKRTHRLS